MVKDLKIHFSSESHTVGVFSVCVFEFHVKAQICKPSRHQIFFAIDPVSCERGILLHIIWGVWGRCVQYGEFGRSSWHDSISDLLNFERCLVYVDWKVEGLRKRFNLALIPFMASSQLNIHMLKGKGMTAMQVYTWFSVRSGECTQWIILAYQYFSRNIHYFEVQGFQSNKFKIKIYNFYHFNQKCTCG